ncbi:hypothetical protein PC358_22510 [Pseudomonas capeferrum]|nr:hypothetical protein PC358_22510 [Pseudomonas capeferrum]
MIGSKRLSAICGARICSGFESAKPPAKASAISVASTPDCSANATTSAITKALQATIIWLQALVTWPAPTAPMCVTRWPRACSTGSARCKSAASPPTMMAKVPASAPGVPPDTGASSQAMPDKAASAAAISRVAVGSRLEKSISNWPLRPPCAMPCSPNTTSRTTAVSARHSSTMSLSRHNSAGVAASRAPAATSSAHLSGLRFHTVSG